MVIKDGKLVAEWYGDGMSAGKPHYISSVTKGVTGLLAELLIADGRLDENRLVKSYVPELADTPFGEATVRDALDMKVNVGVGETSGATDVADAALWSTMALNSRQSAYDTLAAVKADGPNDGNFHYASMTTEVAGWVITRAAGQSYEKLASDLLWSSSACRTTLSSRSIRRARYMPDWLDDLGARPRQARPDDRRSRKGQRSAGVPGEGHRPSVPIRRRARLAERKFQEQYRVSFLPIILVSARRRRSRFDGARRIRPGVVHQSDYAPRHGPFFVDAGACDPGLRQRVERYPCMAG